MFINMYKQIAVYLQNRKEHNWAVEMKKPLFYRAWMNLKDFMLKERTQ